MRDASSTVSAVGVSFASFSARQSSALVKGVTIGADEDEEDEVEEDDEVAGPGAEATRSAVGGGRGDG